MSAWPFVLFELCFTGDGDCLVLLPDSAAEGKHFVFSFWKQMVGNVVGGARMTDVKETEKDGQCRGRRGKHLSLSLLAPS